MLAVMFWIGAFIVIGIPLLIWLFTSEVSLIDVRVLDHVIVGTEGTSSMAEAGLL
jgi:hypothetical protein